jgi:hypothetical protein
VSSRESMDRWTLPVMGAIEAPATSGGRFTYEFCLFPLRKGGRTSSSRSRITLILPRAWPGLPNGALKMSERLMAA